jgi:uncharacterized membrane protein
MITIEAIGRFHPLLVHLPIGIMLFAAALMVFSRLTKAEVGVAVSLAWGTGAVTAILSCILGWYLSQSGDYDVDMVQDHQLVGWLTAGLSSLTFFVRKYRWIPAIATVITLSIAGHYGGNLTHGEGYLFPNKEETLEGNSAAEPLNELAAVVSDSAGKKKVIRSYMYRDEIVLILKTKCYSCHSASKKKGGLRLDSEAFIKGGGKNGSILIPGSPSKSKLFTYLILPEDDERHMPPKGKLQLTRHQLDVIQTWIQRGASFTGEIETIDGGDSASFATSVPLPLPVVSEDVIVAEKPDLEATLLSRPVTEADQQILQKLKSQRVIVTKMLPDAGYLSANLVNTKEFSPEVMNALQGIESQVVRLRLTGQPVRDRDVKYLGQFKNLTRLNLENTKITDSSLTVLAALPNLEHLNLYGTEITDVGLATLASSPNLKMLYLWQTKTTQEGVNKLLKERPSLKIDMGTLEFVQPDTSKVTDKQ